MEWDKQERVFSILRCAEKYIQQAHDAAEEKHDSYGEYYMDSVQYEIMQETETLRKEIALLIAEYENTQQVVIQKKAKTRPKSLHQGGTVMPKEQKLYTVKLIDYPIIMAEIEPGNNRNFPLSRGKKAVEGLLAGAFRRLLWPNSTEGQAYLAAAIKSQPVVVYDVDKSIVQGLGYYDQSSKIVELQAEIVKINQRLSILERDDKAAEQMGITREPDLEADKSHGPMG